MARLAKAKLSHSNGVAKKTKVINSKKLKKEKIMGVGVAIVVSIAILSFCSMITILGVSGMKYGEKYVKHMNDREEKKDEKEIKKGK